GDGTYFYWLSNEYGDFGLSDTDQALVYGYACQSASLVAAVTSAGQTVTREIVLQAPYCP
ncbi:MAG TPA: hypothetical protein DEH25_02470, partial [Chloroflexi bacterium]|nr:hypothetical protein [Chloroflexota bacterium]